MLIEFPHFEGYLLEHNRESLLKKGKDFFKKKFVKHIHAFSGNEWDVYVESERPGVPGYTVRVRIQGGKVTHRNCNCLGFRFGPLCKHIVAALAAIRAEDLYDSDIGEYEAEMSEEDGDMELEKKTPKQSTEKKKDEGQIEEEPEKKSEEPKEEEKVAEKEEERKSPQKKQEKEGAKKRKPARFQKDLLERELECQTCRETVKDPVTLPCQSHSICLKCAESLLEKGRKDKDGAKELSCPGCGKKEGVIRVKNIKDLKSNKELERVRQAYDKEKDNWLKEKEKLEKELEELRNASQKKSNKADSGKIDEEKTLQENLEGADSEKLKEIAEASFYKLKNDGESMDELIEELKDNKKKVEKGSTAKKSGTKQNSKHKGKEDAGKENEEIQIKVSDKTPKKGKGGRASAQSGKKGKEADNSSQKKPMANKGRKGALQQKENEDNEDKPEDTGSGKRGRKASADKENAEGAERYGLRTKKVKTYAE